MKPKILPWLLLLALLSSTVNAKEWFVATNGSDSSGDGTISRPFKTIRHTLSEKAEPKDIITLRSGIYNEEVRVRKPEITIRSMENEWAAIATPVNIDDSDPVVTVTFDVGSKGSRIERVEITGGFYGVFFFSEWDWDDTPLDNDAAKKISITNCRIHDTGRDAIKLPAGCDDILIQNCEIFNSGAGYPESTPVDERNAEGIDIVNCDRILIQNCYIHDTSTTGLYVKGGSTGCTIETCRIENCGEMGIGVGFDTSPEFFDLQVNPEYYENIDGTVRNCVVKNTRYAGIGLYATKNAVIYNNTLVDTAKDGHGAIYLGLTYQDWEEKAGRPGNFKPIIVNNIVFQQESINSPVVSIRYSEDLGGMSALNGPAIFNNNCYFHKNKKCLFEDGRPESPLPQGTFAEWQNHIAGDLDSFEADPCIDQNFQPGLKSPCLNRGTRAIASKNGNATSEFSDLQKFEAVNIGVMNFFSPD